MHMGGCFHGGWMEDGSAFVVSYYILYNINIVPTTIRYNIIVLGGGDDNIKNVT